MFMGIFMGMGDGAVAASGPNTFCAAGGSFPMLSRNVAICQISVSLRVLFHAGMPVQRMPCWMAQKFWASDISGASLKNSGTGGLNDRAKALSGFDGMPWQP